MLYCIGAIGAEHAYLRLYTIRMMLVISSFFTWDMVRYSNVPVEEMVVPSFKNYDFYFDGAYGRGMGSGVSLYLNTVPGPARLSLVWVLAGNQESFHETYLLNYSRYLGILDVGFNMLLGRNADGKATPSAGINLSFYSRSLKVGGGISYLSSLPMEYDSGAATRTALGGYVFSHRAYHRGGEGYNVALGYALTRGKGRVEGHISYKWRGLNPFMSLYAPFEDFPLMVKVGLRLTSMRFRAQVGALLATGVRSVSHVGYVVSIGAELPR